MTHRTTWAGLSMITCTLGLFTATAPGCGHGGDSGAVQAGGTGGSGIPADGSGGKSSTGGSSSLGSSGGTTGEATGGAPPNGSSGGSGSGSGGAQSGGAMGNVGSGGAIASGGGPAVGSGGTAGQTEHPDAGVNPGSGNGSLVFVPSRAAITGVRGVATPPPSETLQLHNGGTAAAQLTGLTLGGLNMSLFHIATPMQFPATIMPGGDLSVTLTMDTGATLPAKPANKDTGETFLTANLTAALSTGSVQIPVFGLAAEQANYEATLGQILTVLGYVMNVGKAQNNWNWNNPNPPSALGGVEAGTDEVAAPLFVKAGPGNVTLVPVARFSPEGEEAFGWYPSGMPTMRNRVSALASIPDAQTSNKARMIYPPLVSPGNTSFDPGTVSFGLWAYTGEAAAGTAYGDYVYSQDALNLPAPSVHRVKVWTLKDANGPVPNSFLVGFEEASNGDYQDYVMVFSNVKVAP